MCSRGVGDSCSRGPQSPVAPLSLCSVPSDSDPRPPSHKGPCDSVRLTQALQDGVSISRSLSHWERPCCRMRSRVPGFAGLGRERRRGLLLGPPPPGCAVPFCAEARASGWAVHILSPLWRVLVLLRPCPWTRPLCPWFPVALARGVAGVSAPRSPRAHSGPPGFPPDVGQPCFRVRLRGLRPGLHFPPKVPLFSRRCV